MKTKRKDEDQRVDENDKEIDDGEGKKENIDRKKAGHLCLVTWLERWRMPTPVWMRTGQSVMAFYLYWGCPGLLSDRWIPLQVQVSHVVTLQVQVCYVGEGGRGGAGEDLSFHQVWTTVLS